MDPSNSASLYGLLGIFMTTMGILIATRMTSKKEKADTAENVVVAALRERITHKDEMISDRDYEISKMEVVISRLEVVIEKMKMEIESLRKVS